MMNTWVVKRGQNDSWDYAIASKIVGDLKSNDIEILEFWFPTAKPEVCY